MGSSAEMVAGLTGADVVYGFCVAVVCIFFPILIYGRDSPFVRQRNFVLTIILWVTALIKFTRVWLAAKDAVVGVENLWGSCAVFVWLTNFPYHVWTSMVVTRSVRLILVFFITKWKLDHEENDELSKRPFWCKEKYCTTKYSLILYACCLSLGFFFTLPIALYAAQSPETACTSSILNIPGQILIALYSVSLLILAWILRKVHDAFGIKKEIQVAAWYTVLFVLPFSLVAFFSVWGWVFGILATAFYDFIFFGTPAFLVIKDTVHKSSEDSSVSKDSIAGDDSSTEPETRQELLCVHKEHKQYFYNMSTLMPHLEQYLLHYQEVKMTHMLLFAIHILKFKQLPNSDALTGKAFLICQKFVFDDAYIHVEDLDPVLKSKFVSKVKEAIESVESNWDPDAPASSTKSLDNKVFDELFVSIREHLYEHLFKPFFKSEQFKEYLKTISLKTGLESV